MCDVQQICRCRDACLGAKRGWTAREKGESSNLLVEWMMYIILENIYLASSSV
jgi:hypothetical protein